VRALLFAGFISICAGAAHADFSVVKVTGEVTVEEKALVSGGTVADGALVESKDSEAYILLKGAAGEVVLKGEFQFEVPEANGKEILARLLSGKVRIKVPKGSKGKDYFRVRTPTAVVGVRGTEFYLSYWPLLSEAEVVCFESDVNFSDATGKIKQNIKAGQWGGLGGRFGQTIAKPMMLTPAMLEHFKAQVPFQ
jgi:hypothetical protein